MPIIPLPPIAPEVLAVAKKAAMEAAAKSKQQAPKIAKKVANTTQKTTNAPKAKQNNQHEIIQFFNVREDLIDPKIMKTKQAQRLMEKSETYAKEIFDAWAIINCVPQYTKKFAAGYIDSIKKWAEHEKASSTVIVSVTNAFFKKIQNIINHFQQSDINLYNLHIVKKGQLEEIEKGRKYLDKALEILDGRDLKALTGEELKKYNSAIRNIKKHERAAREIAGCIVEGNDKNIEAAKKLGLEKEMELIGITQDSKLLHSIYDKYAEGAKTLK